MVLKYRRICPLMVFRSVVFSVVLTFFSPQSAAQLDAYRVAKKRADAAQQGTMEELEARLLQSSFAFNHDMPLASEEANSNLELARKLGNEAAIGASLMQTYLARVWLGGETELGPDFNQYAPLVSLDNASAEICAEYYRQKYLIEFSLGMPNVRESLRKAGEYADQCENRLFRASVYNHVLFTRTSFHPNRAVDREIVEGMKFVEEVSEELSLPSLMAGAHLCLGHLASLPQEERHDHLLKAVKLAREIPEADSLHLIHAAGSLADRANSEGDFATAIQYEKSNIRRARAAKCEILENYSSVRLVDFLLASDQVKEAIPHIERVIASPFRSFDPMDLDFLCRLGMEAYHRTGDLQSALNCASLIMTEEHTQALRALNRSVDGVDSELANLNFELEAEIQDRQKSEEALTKATREANAAAEKNLALVMIVSCILGLAILICLVLIYRDRFAKTQLELTQEKLRATEMAQTLEQKRLESLGVLAGGVAHDFNNLLAGILGSAEYLKMSSLDDRSQERCLEGIIASCEVASDLSRQMLTFSGHRATDLVACNLNAMLHNSALVLETSFSDSPIEIRTAEHPLFAKVDRTQVSQVILNLVSNAVKASENSQKPVIVSAQQRSLTELEFTEEGFVLTPQSAGDFAVIEVEDAGDGVESTEIQSMFEPFYSKFETGKGLGLAVVYGVMSAHHGGIQILAGSPLGTKIRVYFPLDHSLSRQIPAEVVRESHSGPSSLTGARILIVDDEPFVCSSVKYLLVHAGAEVETVESRESALKLLNAGEQFDVQLLDIVMPGMSLADFLAVTDLNSPVVLMTGNSRASMTNLCSDPRIRRVLEKPFRSELLLTAVAEALHSAPVESPAVQ